MEKFLALAPEDPLYQLLEFTVNAYVPIHISVTFEFSVTGYQKEMKAIGKGYQLSRDAWLMSKPKDILVSKRVLLRK